MVHLNLRRRRDTTAALPDRASRPAPRGRTRLENGARSLFLNRSRVVAIGVPARAQRARGGTTHTYASVFIDVCTRVRVCCLLCGGRAPCLRHFVVRAATGTLAPQ